MSENVESGRSIAGVAGVTRVLDGLGPLMSGVVKDLQGVLQGEVRLAKTELKEEAVAAGGAAALAGASGVVGLLGGVFLVGAVAELLAKRMARWQAFGLVGLGLTGAAAGLGVAGKNRLKGANLAPRRTIESLKQDAQLIAQRVAPTQPAPAAAGGDEDAGLRSSFGSSAGGGVEVGG